MAEVMSMISEDNSPGELNADEQDSLQVGEEMEQQQEQMLAGKFKSAQDLESAYLELQKKLGQSDVQEEPEEPTEQEETVDDSFLDRLWEESQGEYSEETLSELSSMKPEDLAQMYLEYRNNVQEVQPTAVMTEQDVTNLKGMVGGDENYDNMVSWAGENFNEQEIDLYDRVMESGDAAAAFFAIQALAFRYQDSVGTEGELVQGKAPNNTQDVFESQAELVEAMGDPRYSRDPAYRDQIMKKLSRSNIDF